MARPSRTNVLIGIDRAQRIYDEDHNNRRPYIMLERRKMHSWDDFDFFFSIPYDKGKICTRATLDCALHARDNAISHTKCSYYARCVSWLLVACSLSLVIL
ncbi:uncharacterized protein LOC118736323 [Rhagoletis pomonella]|uniref:uncharacterized protein LOC118736323 n=1 Tax=Rhagoletis pomonella TaxID=28610 RepID=UPI00177DE39A|nr:uncharacterized protein LOC118736323 [Rhagoletis pomonella]